MPEENMNQEIEEINWNELMSKKHKRVCRVLNCIDHLFIAISTVIGCVSFLLLPHKLVL